MHAVPFRPYVPTEQDVQSFAALPYDVFDRAEAAAYVSAHPHSFLAIDRPETLFAPAVDMYSDEVYAAAHTRLIDEIKAGTLKRDEKPSYYLYELTWHGNVQTGIVAASALADYANDDIRKHELTRPEKEQDRIRHIKACGAQTGPIFLVYPDNQTLADLMATVKERAPRFDFVDVEDVRQRVWNVDEESEVRAFAQALGDLPRAYIADGHHRAASAAKVAAELAASETADLTGDPLTQEATAPGSYLLTVYFPASELTVLPYNRLVHDQADYSADELLAAIKDAGFSVRTQEAAVSPREPHHFGMYLSGQWYELVDKLADPQDPVEALDVSRLQNRILEPLFKIDDPRTSDRITFVGGHVSAPELAKRAKGESVAFTLCATSVSDLISVADAHKLMPPKSTWFEPKLRSGIFIRPIFKDIN